MDGIQNEVFQQKNKGPNLRFGPLPLHFNINHMKTYFTGCILSSFTNSSVVNTRLEIIL